MPFSIASSAAIVAEAEVLNLKPPSKVGTGICFLDHMVDQLTSHGQLGVTLRCGIATPVKGATASGKRDAPEPETRFFAPLRDYATGLADRPHDRDIFIACGSALGAALRCVVDEVKARSSDGAANGSPAIASALFCCPLDEALAEAVIDLAPAEASREGECSVRLEPYGTFAAGASGRRWIGRFRTEYTPLFWEALAGSLGCTLSLCRVRGANAHHVLESNFKAFARAFRAALDRLADGQPQGCAAPGAGPAPTLVAPSMPRIAERRRATKETTIEVRVDLDAPWRATDEPAGAQSAWDGAVMTATALTASVQASARVSTGIAMLDAVIDRLARGAGIQAIVRCEGDRHIDDHHTAEDVAITLGQCLHEALGDKAGLARMGCAEGGDGGAVVRCVMDLSNRPHFESNLPLDEEYVGAADGAGGGVAGGGEGRVTGGDADGSVAPWDALCGGVLSCEMLYHVFNSLTLEMRATCHLELRHDKAAAGHTADLALAAAEAYGAALSRALRVDPRRRGAVASSKGTLSK